MAFIPASATNSLTAARNLLTDNVQLAVTSLSSVLESVRFASASCHTRRASESIPALMRPQVTRASA